MSFCDEFVLTFNRTHLKSMVLVLICVSAVAIYIMPNAIAESSRIANIAVKSAMPFSPVNCFLLESLLFIFVLLKVIEPHFLGEGGGRTAGQLKIGGAGLH